MNGEIWRPSPRRARSRWWCLAWIAALLAWSRVPLFDSMPVLGIAVSLFIGFKILRIILPDFWKQDPPRAARAGDFEVVLISVGRKRIEVIKVLREYDLDVPIELTRGSLAANYVAVRNVDAEYAHDVVAALNKAGAQAEGGVIPSKQQVS